MSEFKNLTKIIESYKKLETELSNINDTSKIAELSKKFSDMTPLVTQIMYLEKIEKELVDVESLVSSSDKELRDIAFIEKEKLQNQIEKQKMKLKFY